MVQAWRIVKTRHAATAFDGEGARLYGGRWNSVGRRVVYASGTKALASLEILVHLQIPGGLSFVAIPLHFDEALVEVYPVRRLPAGWDAEPPGAVSQRIGDAWLDLARAPVLALPSVLTGETNFLLDPGHPDFGRIKRGAPEPFAFDPRLLAGRAS
jgi:RES domain-containing protein